MPTIVILIINDNTWNLKPVSKEEFQSSAFLGPRQKIFEIFALDSSKKVVRPNFSLPTSDLRTASAKFKNDLL